MKGSKAALVILVLTGVFALATGFPLLTRFIYVLIFGLALTYAWTWLNLRRLEISADRRTARTQVGRRAEESITVRNHSILGKTYLEVQDKTTMPGHYAGAVVSLGAKTERSWDMEMECQRRGVFTLGPVTVATGDPFGLFRLERSMGGTHTLVVYPATVDLPYFSLPPSDLPGGAAFYRRSLSVTPNAYGVREYTPGDTYNRIHWPTTARLGRLMVKEFETEPSSDVWIVVDAHAAAQVGVWPDNSEEYACTAAASIARKYLENNYTVGLLAYGAEAHVLRASRGDAQLIRILEALASLRAKGTLSLADVLAAGGHRFSRHTTVVLITPSMDESWLAAVRFLVRRKVKVAVVLLDAATFGGSGNALPVVGGLTALSVPMCVMKKGESLSTALRLDMAPPSGPVLRQYQLLHRERRP
ncbi:MAG: DUF58 domain-containing protein [Chloroflexi bacterium]|nr:DUF58 domain-containing protein [Chloroflexota bacterium]